MLTNHRNDQLYLIGVREQAISDGRSQVTFFTTRSDLVAYTRICRGMRQAVIMLGGDDENGLDSEFNSAARELENLGIGSVQLDYRCPGDYAQCAIDALLACQYLDDEGISDVVLVGWSFGAEVALAAGSVARIVRGVAAISPWDVSELSSRRMCGKQLLLMREDAENICFIDNDGRELPKTRHQIRNDLVQWIHNVFGSTRSAESASSTYASLAR